MDDVDSSLNAYLRSQADYAEPRPEYENIINDMDIIYVSIGEAERCYSLGAHEYAMLTSVHDKLALICTEVCNLKMKVLIEDQKEKVNEVD